MQGIQRGMEGPSNHLRTKEVISLALMLGQGLFPYRTDRFEGFTQHPGWG